MPQNGIGIDWDKAGQQSAPPFSIDWENAHQTPVPHEMGAAPPEEHPIAHRVGELVNDIKYGPAKGDNRLLERIMRGVGLQGTERGAGGGGVGGMMPGAGLLEGGSELIHSLSSLPQVHDWSSAKKVANEGLGGLFKAVGTSLPVAAPEVLPALIPGATTAGVINSVAQGVTKHMGGDEDAQELAGNVAMGVLPGAYAKAKPIGEALVKNAPAIGRTGAYGATVAKIAHGAMNAEKFNPLDLIIASPPAVKAATGMVESTGNALINRPGVTEMTPGEPAPSSNPANPLIHSGPQPGYRQKNFFTDVKTNEAPEPKGLIGSGSVIPPEPGKSTVTDIHDEGPQLVNAQPLVTRGKGGRMQKSFTAAESTGQPLINPGPAWRGPGTEAPSVEPPRVIDNELQPQRSAEAQAAESPLIETNGEVLPPEKPKLGNGEETPEESRLMDEYARQHDLEHNPIEGESSKTHPLGDPENQNIEGDRLDYEQGKRENSKFEEPEQTDGGGGDQPPRNKPQAETPEGPEGKVLPGDFSLNQPTKFYHGSENPNLINTGLEANFPMGIHEGFGEKEAGIGGEHIPDDATHEDYTGVFMTDDPATADWWSRHYDPKTDGPVPGTRYEINMPRGSRMRLDPEESVLDPEKHDLVYNGDIPSGRVSTEEDRLDNKARQQELRQSEDQQLIRTNAIDRAEMYRGNKVYTSRKTGQQGYEPSPLGVRAPDEEIYPKLPELGSHSENIQPERRQDPNRRQLINSMTAEEMKKELLSSPTVDLPNRRAFNEIETHSPAKAVAMSDADGLKAFNDKFGYEAGDALLKAKAEALKEAGVDAYHDKGDEFVYRGKSPETLKQDLERAREILRNRTIEVTLKDGTVKRYKGADFSYGTGENLEQAESGLKTHKAAREQSGERARGELRGITEAGAKKDKPSKGSTK